MKKTRTANPVLIFFAVLATCGTLAAATGFIVEYEIGGAATQSLTAVAGYMWGTHALIGVGEGLITAVTVMAVARTRPDLVYLLRARPQSVAADTTRMGAHA